MTNLLRNPPPLLVPPNATSSLRLAGQTAFDPSSSHEPPYVLHTVPFDRGYLFAGSDDSVRAFTRTLEPLGTLRTTQKGVSSLAPGSARDSNVAFVTAKDGTVAGWDLRDLTKEAFKVRGKSGAPYLCASQSSDQSCLAVGTETFQYEAMIDFWDLRAMQLQHTYTESHSDDITTLSFHPSPELAHVLLSGSVDGVLNTYDVRIADEDDAVQSTLQVGTSVVDAGWMRLPGHSEIKGVWGTTTIETLQIWDADEQNLLHDLGDIRDVALQPWRSEYLIGAHFNPALGGVCLLAGTNGGDVAVLNAAQPRTWVMEQVLSGAGGRTLATNRGHTDIVRCAHLDTDTSTVVTGGEDGQICLWSV
ncbi:hypothetical protein JCM3766R1_004112 [Sporobolomyces carnicolor]